MKTALTELVGLEWPIIQAPMAGSSGSELAIAVSVAGGLGSLPCAMLDAPQARAQLIQIRERTTRPVNVNFFCHAEPVVDQSQQDAWARRLAGYYRELGLDPDTPVAAASRAAFDEEMCAVIEELQPPVVSFHFGLPAQPLVDRVRATGATVLSSATTVDEARWLEDHGCDAVIAQGLEAGGHRGMFLTADPGAQVGTMALVPQVVDAVGVPVIAAGGIADGRGIAAALTLGAAGVQIGTGFLRCPEASTSPLHRRALAGAGEADTALTNVFTGRPARGLVNRVVAEVGPLTDLAPAFPLAAGSMAPLRAKAEADGSTDFSPLWSGQAARLARELPAGQLVRQLGAESEERLAALASG